MNAEQNILPMKQPLITSYPFHANLLSVLTNYDESLPWVYNNYVQLHTLKDFSQGVRLDFYSGVPLWKTCPWIYYQRIARDLIAEKWTSITDFILDCLKLNKYVYLLVDRFYVSEYPAYQKNHSVHDIFIYGYDTGRRVFSVADFFKEKKYYYAEVSFDEIEQGYQSIKQRNIFDWMNGVEVINFRRQYDDRFHSNYEFDRGLLIEFLTDFINSTDTARRYKIPTEQWHKYWDWSWGTSVYQLLSEYSEFVLQSETPIDIRSFHVLVDHKHIMVQRIHFLEENQYISSSTLSHEFKLLLNEAIIIRTMLLKYRARPDKQIIQRVQERLLSMQQQERAEIEKLINLLTE